MHAANKDFKDVYVGGLITDFKGAKFGNLMDLMPYADDIQRVRGKCAFCDRPSIHTARKMTEL